MEKSIIVGDTGGGGERTSRETRVFVKNTFLQIFLQIKVFCIKRK